ncbi:hypothetical protein [Hydrogenivirga sp. 128-5-R1-1]|uniref:hypothetical protein n=1 Tax=Hydrogenivirga sp. 128-5-R1-1 TaxID=392423 RepID=UPI00015EFCEE|nr:hypothetical protein [Hydrogenivirga sp. 128-5-R1-1]EDP74514.1 hypothetical protein HG1285_01598 [Hydrogenivirga sp. 128-5-R1-1]
MKRVTTTVRLSEEKARLLRAIAGYEGKRINDIINELIDEYINRHRETLELLSIPNFLEECREGLEEIKRGGGKKLSELDD